MLQTTRRALALSLLLSILLSLFALPASASVFEAASDLAADALAAGNALIGQFPSDHETALEISRKEALRRLRHLGVTEGCSGDGMTDLNAAVTEGDVILIGARLMGYSAASVEEAYTLLSDAGLLYRADSYNAAKTATTDLLGIYLLKALGYPLSDSALARFTAFAAMRTIGIWDDKLHSDLHAGDAALMIFRSLQTTNTEGEVLSFALLQKKALQYADVVYLIWSDSQAETDNYIWAAGYETEGPVEGYYTITVNKNPAMCLNALMSAVNTDKDGVGVTLWRSTGDVSQTFRLEKTESGAYRIFCAASKSGYNRLVGVNKKGTLALYRQTSAYAKEFYIYSAGNGGWYLVDAATDNACLTVEDVETDGAAVTLAPIGSNDVDLQTWTLTRQGALNEDGVEVALYPSTTLRITQKAWEKYSHGEQNAIDLTTLNKRVFAPFTGTVVRIDTSFASCNAVWVESNEPVLYADGTVDYMTVIFMHDNYVRDLSVGQVVMQGEYFYDMGTAGNASGSHVHVAVIRGRYENGMKLTGSGDVYAEEAFFLLPNVTVLDPCDIEFSVWAE